MAENARDAGGQTFDVLVMRFYGWGPFAVDFNIHGTTIDKHATLTLGPTNLQIQRTNRRGKPTTGSAIDPSLWTGELGGIRAAQVFRTPWFMRLGTIDAAQHPLGVFLDMGAWVSSWGLFSVQFDALVEAFRSRDVRTDTKPRR